MRIAASLMMLTLVTSLAASALAEPPQRPATPRQAVPDEPARRAREINRWLLEHPEMAEKIIRNFRQQRGRQAARPAPGPGVRTKKPQVQRRWGEGPHQRGYPRGPAEAHAREAALGNAPAGASRAVLAENGAAGATVDEAGSPRPAAPR